MRYLTIALLVALLVQPALAQELSDEKKGDTAFKKAISKDPRAKDNQFYEETDGGGFTIHADDVWSESINLTPATCVSDGVCEDRDGDERLTLTEDTTVAGKKGWCAASAGDCVTGTRLRDWVPPKYGSGYTVSLYDSTDTKVPETDTITWYFDYEAGYLSMDCSGSCVSQTGFKIDGFRYVGAAVSSSAYTTVKDEDSPLTKRRFLNFTGAGVSCVDDAVDTTDCTVSGGGGSGAFSDAGDPIVQNTTTKDVHIGDGAGTLTGKLEIGGDDDQPQLVVEGHLTQTDSLIIAQNDADTEVFTVSVTGGLYAAEGLGVNTTTPDEAVEIIDGTDEQLRLTDTDGTQYCNFRTNSSGRFELNCTGTDPHIQLNEEVLVGASTEPLAQLEVVDTVDAQLRLTQFAAVDYADFTVDSSGNMDIAMSGTHMTIGADAFGVGTTSPDEQVEILDGTDEQLMLTNTDATDFCKWKVDASGNLTRVCTGAGLNNTTYCDGAASDICYDDTADGNFWYVQDRTGANYEQRLTIDPTSSGATSKLIIKGQDLTASEYLDIVFHSDGNMKFEACCTSGSGTCVVPESACSVSDIDFEGDLDVEGLGDFTGTVTASAFIPTGSSSSTEGYTVWNGTTDELEIGDGSSVLNLHPIEDFDTEAEAETLIFAGANVIVATEIDTGAELAAIMTDETGSGANVHQNAPTINDGQTDVEAGKTAGSGNQGTGVCSAAVCQYSTVGIGGDATLPAAPSSGSRQVVIIHSGLSPLQVWPASGDNAGAGVNNNITLSAGNKLICHSWDATNWHCNEVTRETS